MNGPTRLALVVVDLAARELRLGARLLRFDAPLLRGTRGLGRHAPLGLRQGAQHELAQARSGRRQVLRLVAVLLAADQNAALAIEALPGQGPQPHACILAETRYGVWIEPQVYFGLGAIHVLASRP